MSGPGELFWRLLPDVRRGERTRFLFFSGLFTLVSLAQTMGLAGAEALFLGELGVDALPATLIAASLVTVLASMYYAVRVGVLRNDIIFIRWLLMIGALIILAAWGVSGGRIWLLPVLLCTWYSTTAIFTNHFWTFSGDYFDTIASKRLVPYFTIGASVGGAVGGLVSVGVVQFFQPVALIAGWGVALGAAALLLRLTRRPLRRWGPLDLEEADETSVEGLQSAIRFLRSSSLARWLVASALAMVLALFLSQYLYSDIFTRAFPEPAQLALFISVYLAVTNLVEILFEVALTPFLIRRLGVAGANLVHPLTLLLSFAGMAVTYTVPTGVGARVSRELIENSVAAPVRSLVQNAAPSRFRGKLRAFLEGIVVYAGMSMAGVVLLLVRDPEPVWLCAAGAGASLLYLAANWRARRVYLDTLVQQLRAGRLDIGEVGDSIGRLEANRLAELWEEALRWEGRRPSSALLQLLPTLAARGIVDPLVRAASHPSAEVRRASVNALASVGGDSVAGPLGLALDDPDPGVRLASLRGLSRMSGDPAFLSTRLADLLRDLDPRVRAEAALRAGPEGGEVLTKMIASQSAPEATAALAVATDALLPAVLERVGAADAVIRAAVLECIARIAPEPPLETAEVLALLHDPDTRVRRAAVLLLSNIDDEDALRALGGCLTDPAPDVQFAAEIVLGSLGPDGVAAVEPYLRSDIERAVEGALRVVATSDAPDSRAILLFELRRRVRDLWRAIAAYQLLPRGRQLGLRFLRAAVRDTMLRDHRLAFRILELLENPNVIQKVDRELRRGGSRTRANALEVLSNLGDREASNLLVLTHVQDPLDERLRIAAGLVPLPTSLPDVLAAAHVSQLRWIRMGAAAYDPQEDAPAPEEETMERLLALKQVDLFGNLSLEQLDAVHRVAREVEYLANEVVFREGERGDSLFLLLDGTVAFVKGHGTEQELQLGTEQAIGYFGEMAILDDAARSATVMTLTPARMLTLDGASLKDLILQMPEISFEIFRVLTARIRTAEERLAAV